MWLVRLLLVLLLMVDQVSAPLHAHAHDFGFGGFSSVSEIQQAPTHEELHAERKSGEHSILAVRGNTRTAVATSSSPIGDDQDAIVPTVLEIELQADPRRRSYEWPHCSERWFSTETLRPQVRAPPLRA